MISFSNRAEQHFLVTNLCLPMFKLLFCNLLRSFILELFSFCFKYFTGVLDGRGELWEVSAIYCEGGRIRNEIPGRNISYHKLHLQHRVPDQEEW